VYLEIPSDVPRQEAPVPSGAAPRYGAFAPEPMPAIDADAAGMAAQRIHASRRPVILAGMDANDEVTSSRLVAFAEEWSIPVIDSPKAKGVFPEDHPLFVGTIEMLGTSRLYDYIAKSDLVLMIGFDPVEFDRDWLAPAPVIHLGPLPNDDRYYRADVEVVGPINEAIDAIRSLCGAPEPKWKAEEVFAIRSEFRAYVSPARETLTAQQVLGALRDAMPRDAIATCDVGQNKAVTGQVWTAYAPKTFFMSNGLSSMGYGLPAALGLQLLDRERKVACVLGDGGFAMTMAEMETAVRMALPVIVVVLADEALTQIKAGQERKGYPVTGTTFRPLDYVAIAKGFGAAGHEVETVAECREAFAAARYAKGPVLIAAHIDPSAYRLD
jgi:acetolactate synthase-1/2/3 large subunit